MAKQSNQNHRKEQKQAPLIKAKKLDIEFDSIGKSDYGATDEETKEEPKVIQKVASATVENQPRPQVMDESSPKTAETVKPKKKMMSITSTDYERS